MIILATDFDETLKRHGKVSKEDLLAIQKFREKGNLFGIVSGRSLGMLKLALKVFKIQYDFLIGDNGGFIMDQNHKMLYEKEIRFEKALEIIEEMKKMRPGVGGYNDGYNFTVFTHRKTIRNIVRSFALSFLGVKEEVILKRGKILSFFFNSDDPKQVEELYQCYKDDPEVSCVKNGTKVVDLSAPGVDKSVAISKLKEIFGVEQVVVIGDSANDLQMIKEHNGFAISNAEPEVKKAARKIVKDFTELVKEIETEERI